MTKDNETNKTTIDNLDYQTEREEQIAKDAFKIGYDLGKTIGVSNAKLASKIRRKKNAKIFLDGFCYTYTVASLLAVVVTVCKIKLSK